MFILKYTAKRLLLLVEPGYCKWNVLHVCLLNYIYINWIHLIFICRFTQIAEFDEYISQIDFTPKMNCLLNSNYTFQSRTKPRLQKVKYFPFFPPISLLMVWICPMGVVIVSFMNVQVFIVPPLNLPSQWMPNDKPITFIWYW